MLTRSCWCASAVGSRSCGRTSAAEGTTSCRTVRTPATIPGCRSHGMLLLRLATPRHARLDPPSAAASLAQRATADAISSRPPETWGPGQQRHYLAKRTVAAATGAWRFRSLMGIGERFGVASGRTWRSKQTERLARSRQERWTRPCSTTPTRAMRRTRCFSASRGAPLPPPPS